MNLIICLDEKNGMLFNNRRQSSDVMLRKKIFEIVGDKKLYMNEYSKRQFLESNENIVVSNSFLDLTDSDDFCFIENIKIDEYIDTFNNIVIFRWNKVYPSDVKFDIELLKSFKKGNAVDFKGHSHEKITMEVYSRV